MWRVVDIAEDSRTLLLSRNNLRVVSDDTELGRVPLSDIQSVVVHGRGTMISLTLTSALAEAGIPLILCNQNHHPVAISLPVSNNYEQAARLSAQAQLSASKQKRLWREIVRAKIKAQSQALETARNPEHQALLKFLKIVRSGDPENIEAQAARFYWRRLLGKSFRRDVSGDGLNAHLNYGYAVIRGATARAVVSAGLSPGLGLHHRARLNPFQLVDDLMEPFRPIVDFAVWRNKENWTDSVTSPAKQELANLINGLMSTDGGLTAVTRVMNSTCQSLSDVCLGKAQKINLPTSWMLQQQDEFEFGQ